MITIHKYPLEITGQQGINIHGYMKVLSVKEQRSMLVLYALVDTDPSIRGQNLPVTIIGTGHVVNCVLEDWEFVDTVMMANGLVWHIFIKKSE